MIVAMSGKLVAPLEERLRPQPVELDLAAIGEAITAAQDELRLVAMDDLDRCCGYFPALAGLSGIRTELPACRAFAEALTAISHAGMTYGFNFLRLSLVRQSADPAFHLDSDAATALTGDVGPPRTGGTVHGLAPMGDGEVVEDKQVPGAQRNVDLDGRDIESEMLEEVQLGGDGVELHPTEKAGGGLHAGQAGHAGGHLDNARQATLGIAIHVVPRPVRLPVRHQVGEERCPIRPTPLAKQSLQRHKPRDRRDPDRGARDGERRVPRHILIAPWVEREAEVEVEGLEIAGRFGIGRGQDEVADQLSTPWPCDVVRSSMSS
jgi:hypothetical protein